MERYAVFDKDGNTLSKTYLRGTHPPKGEYFLVIHVWIRHVEGKYLIQKRGKTTDRVPNQWATTSGGVNHDETPLQAAIRETEEELGLTLKPDDLTEIRTVVTHEGQYQTIAHIYIHETTTNLEALSPDGQEVKAIAFESLDTIRTMIQQGMFWDYPQLLHDEDYFSSLER